MESHSLEIPLEPAHWHYKNEGACNVILSHTGVDPTLNVEVLSWKLDPTQWEYKGEGINNIILSFSGSHLSPSLSGHVLRLKKTSSSKAIHTHALVDREVVEYLFVRDVMKPKIGPDYVHPGAIVKVNHAFLQSVSETVQPLRPPHRLVADIDVHSSSAFILPDLSIFPKAPAIEGKSKHTFCIEIKGHDKIQCLHQFFGPFGASVKIGTIQRRLAWPLRKDDTQNREPKWGFVSASPFIHPNHQIKTQACRYCLHQHLKLLQGSIHNISDYCPQDLYSNDPERIKKSLKALFESPQNNLKVYCDGELCFTGSLGGRKASDTDFNLNSLAAKLKNTFPNSKDTIASLSDVLLQILQKEPVLQNLRKIQVQDDIDIEAIYYLYKKHTLNSTDFSDVPDVERFQSLDSLSSEEVSEKLKKFMVAATAKDCSVMISLLPVENTTESFKFLSVPSEGNIQYRIGVVDLDERVQSLIPQYYKLDQNIVSEFLAHSKGSSSTIKCL